MRILAIMMLGVLLSGCITLGPPSNTRDICTIFDEQGGWYDDAKDAEKRWGTPIPVMMAIMHQESRFVANARPPRKDGFLFFPGKRPSSAYGYAQALDGTWDFYQRSTGNWGADRDNFEDAIDFIGWYTALTRQKNRVAATDAKLHYLNYHEGWTGYARGSHNRKRWLLDVSGRVGALAQRYEMQLSSCRHKFERKFLFFF